MARSARELASPTRAGASACGRGCGLLTAPEMPTVEHWSDERGRMASVDWGRLRLQTAKCQHGGAAKAMAGREFRAGVEHPGSILRSSPNRGDSVVTPSPGATQSDSQGFAGCAQAVRADAYRSQRLVGPSETIGPPGPVTSHHRECVGKCRILSDPQRPTAFRNPIICVPTSTYGPLDPAQQGRSVSCLPIPQPRGNTIVAPLRWRASVEIRELQHRAVGSGAGQGAVVPLGEPPAAVHS
jgi:hypothetical protein